MTNQRNRGLQLLWFIALMTSVLAGCSKTPPQPSRVADTCHLANMVSAARLETYDWRITAARFPVDPTWFTSDRTKVFQFDRIVTTAEARKTMLKEGYFPAGIEHDLAFAASRANIGMIGSSLVALGSAWEDDGFRWVPVLTGNKMPRGIELAPAADEAKWETYYAFLGVEIDSTTRGTAPADAAACDLMTMVKDANLTEVDEHITVAAFPVDRAAYTVDEGRIAGLDVDAVDAGNPWKRADGNKSATLENLLAMGKRYPGRQKSSALLAMGARWLDGGELVHACLFGTSLVGCREAGWDKWKIGFEDKSFRDITVEYLVMPDPDYAPEPPAPKKKSSLPPGAVKTAEVLVPAWLAVSPAEQMDGIEDSWGLDEQKPALGNMWGDEIGDAFGVNGLGLTGSDKDAPKTGSGIGLGDIGTRH